jgi:hypothetical protein
MNHDHFIVPSGEKIRMKDYDPGFTSHYKNKDEASAKLREDIQQLARFIHEGAEGGGWCSNIAAKMLGAT